MTIIPIKGMIGWDVTPRDVSEGLAAANGGDVTLEIASGGGFIAPGLDIFNQIRNYPGNVTAKLVGFAMSMASYIPLAADRVIAEDNAIFMIHNARGFTGGDHNDVLKYGNFLKGLSGVIAQQYVKRTGKSLDEVTDLMDEETFFFGEEMVDNGFVDEIIQSEEDNDDDQETAMAKAQAAFEDVVAKMSSDTAAAKADLSQAAAMVKKFTKPPAAKAGKPQKEEQQMTLADLLSANPAAKIEFNAALAAAQSEGDTAGREAMAATIKKVSPFLNSKEYPEIIGTTAVAVLKGDSEMSELTASVAAVDAVRADAEGAAAAAAAANGKETPGEQPPAARKEGEPTSSEADLQADIAAFRGED